MLRQGIALIAVVAMAACTGEGQSRGSADMASVARAAYQHPGPSSLTLYTVRSNRTGAGGHTALLVNGSQRVIFDPAGSFHHDEVPRVDDVLYGITPSFELGYRSMHARPAYHVVSQTVEVSPEVAEKALRLVEANGPVPQTQCATATAAILKQLPGFEGIQSSLYPERLEESFQQVTGVRGTKYYEDFTPPAGG